MRNEMTHMAKTMSQDKLAAIVTAVRTHPGGAGIRQIAAAVPADWPRRTLQHLVKTGHLSKQGEGRWTTYHLPDASKRTAKATVADANAMPLSAEAAEIRAHPRQPPIVRTPVGYNRAFLDAYRLPSHARSACIWPKSGGRMPPQRSWRKPTRCASRSGC